MVSSPVGRPSLSPRREDGVVKMHYHCITILDSAARSFVGYQARPLRCNGDNLYVPKYSRWSDFRTNRCSIDLGRRLDIGKTQSPVFDLPCQSACTVMGRCAFRRVRRSFFGYSPNLLVAIQKGKIIVARHTGGNYSGAFPIIKIPADLERGSDLQSEDLGCSSKRLAGQSQRHSAQVECWQRGSPNSTSSEISF